MGNKSTFVFIFFVFGIVFQFLGISSARASTLSNHCTGANFVCDYKKGETLCLHPSSYVGACRYAPDIPSLDRDHDCIKKYPHMPKPKCPSTKANTCSKNNYAACKTPASCKAVGGEMLDGVCSAPPPKKVEEPVTTNDGSAEICKKEGGTWNSATKSCSLNGKECPQGSGMSECLKNAAKKEVPSDNASTAKCGPNTIESGVFCNCTFKNKSGIYASYVAGNQAEQTTANCPEKDETGEAVVTEDEADAKGLKCIQEIRDKINACKAASTKSVKACDLKSEENAETMKGATQLAQSSQQFMHASIAEQCTNMGLVTGATGMGLHAIKGTCNAEMKSCVDACSDVQDYTNAKDIQAACATAATEEAKQLEKEASQLASVMEKANKECVTKSEELLKQVGSNLASMVNGYRVAAQCENQVTSKPVAVEPELMNCIASPNAAGCKVDCISNKTHPQCSCLLNPSAAGCQKGAGSELAGGNPNGKIQFSPINGSGSIKPSAGGGPNGGSELDLYVDDEGNPIPISVLEDGEKKGGLFGQAAAALGGSGGGGTGDGASGKGKVGAASDEEDKGLFGGVFQSLKSAAGSLFGSGSGGSGSAAKKAAASKEAGFNAAGLKPISGNKNLRGLASSGNVCFVDTKGTRVCFGTKNEDIWMKMQKQYSLQYNTFITDK